MTCVVLWFIYLYGHFYIESKMKPSYSYIFIFILCTIQFIILRIPPWYLFIYLVPFLLSFMTLPDFNIDANGIVVWLPCKLISEFPSLNGHTYRLPFRSSDSPVVPIPTLCSRTVLLEPLLLR